MHDASHRQKCHCHCQFSCHSFRVSIFFVTMNSILRVSLLAIYFSCDLSTSSSPKSSADLDVLDDSWRIIGGELAVEGELKYQLSLRLSDLHHCGASLIQVQGLLLGLTAAHCTDGIDIEEFTLVAGDLQLSNVSGREQLRQVSRIVNHEDYDPDAISNDIGLLFVDAPFILTDFVGPIPLPEAGINTKGTGLVSGWGIYNFQGSFADNLTKLEVPIVSDEICRKAYAPLKYEFFDHFICAGFLGGEVFKDTCTGDSGGPLKSIEGGYLAGIVSWSEGCAHPKYPGVNTEVSYFVSWINDQVTKHLVPPPPDIKI